MYLLGGSVSDLPNLDGMDMWSSLSSDKASPRNLMLHNIDESRHIAAVRVGDWKLVKGRKKFVLFCNNAFSDFFFLFRNHLSWTMGRLVRTRRTKGPSVQLQFGLQFPCCQRPQINWHVRSHQIKGRRITERNSITLRKT